MPSKAHRCEVFRLKEVVKHPNADRLEIIQPWGYNCVVEKGLHKPGDLLVYIPPHNIVPDTELYADVKRFNKGSRNPMLLRSMRLRGYLSMGYIIPAPAGAAEGDDVTEMLGVVPYEPPQSDDAQGVRVQPQIYDHEEDIDPLRRFPHVIPPGELCFITEKVHGQNIRVVVTDGKLYVGNRAVWYEESDRIFAWRAAKGTPGLFEAAHANPGMIFYAEGIPCQRGFHYGASGERPYALLYKVMRGDDGNYLCVGEYLELAGRYGLATVPVLGANIPFDYEMLQELANGPSRVMGANHGREGIVVEPMEPRNSLEIGRVLLKLHGSDFLGEE